MDHLKRMWSWISQTSHQKTLAFLGAAIAAAAGAAWQAYAHFSTVDSPTFPLSPVIAMGSAIAAGGNITAAGDITIGISLEEYEAGLRGKEKAIRAELAKLKPQDAESRQRLEAQQAAVTASLARLETTYKQHVRRLADAAGVLEKLKDDLAPEVRLQAQVALTKGDSVAAEKLFHQVVGERKDKKRAALAARQLARLAQMRHDTAASEKYLHVADQLAGRPQPYFLEDFDGRALKKEWEVINPDSGQFALDNGKLLAFTSVAADIGAGDVPNLFRLARPMPEGDWEMTIKLFIKFQTAVEGVFFGLYAEKDNWLGALVMARRNDNWSHTIGLGGAKSRGGGVTSFEKPLVPHKGVAWEQFVREHADMPVYLVLRKRRYAYTVSGRFAGAAAGEPSWVELETLTHLNAKGSLAFGLYQREQTRGESLMEVDWVKIETPK